MDAIAPQLRGIRQRSCVERSRHDRVNPRAAVVAPVPKALIDVDAMA